jgi:hypothetical protein
LREILIVDLHNGEQLYSGSPRAWRDLRNFEGLWLWGNFFAWSRWRELLC